MDILPFIYRLITSPQRSRNKNLVIKKVSSRIQENIDVINIHRIDSMNVGDFYSAPHHYFEILRGKKLDIFDYKITNKKVTDHWIEEVSNNSLIIGGGGLLNRGSFEKQIKLFQSLAQKNKKTVIWGAGHNSKNPRDFKTNVRYNINIGTFGLAGTRDFGATKNWVPCVSCLHPVFDKKYMEKRELGVVFSKKTFHNRKVTNKFKDYTCYSNTTDIQNLVKFIGTSEKIITDSYHVMYWSILLEKKVVVVPNSSKFFDFKYQPTISTFDRSIDDLKKTVSYSGILEECRERNHLFADKVFNYLNL